ncbi:MAG: putative maltokinase, partial [Nitrospira sp.]|nr:putative maltokinase [Nitrospira sp.]
MYRVFAHDKQSRINLGIRRRLTPLLGNDRKKIELMYSLLFSMPGTPVIYYGEEIGMGDNFYLGDRNGVRTPMQWSADRNAGFSYGNPQKLYLPIIIDPEYHYEAVNVELQQNNAQSPLWWMKRIVSLRKRYKVFGRGSIEFLHPSNRKVLVFLRRYQDETILVAVNLSRHAQWVELDLAEFKGRRPLTLFGRSKFPAIGDLPYLLTLSGHAFYWFALEPVESKKLESQGKTEQGLPTITISKDWDNLIQKREKVKLENLLPQYLQGRRWFGGKARTMQFVEITETIPLPQENPLAVLALIRVEYTEGEPEMYLLPLQYIPADRMAPLVDSPAAIARVRVKMKDGEQEGLLIDAMWDREFQKLLLDSISRNRRFTGPTGDLVTQAMKIFRRQLQKEVPTLEPTLLKGEQSNSSVLFGHEFILKLYRRAEVGVNPDFEIGRFLTNKGFPHIAPLAGAIEYQRDNGDLLTFGILQKFIQNEGDAWKYTLDELSRYLEEALTHPTAITTSSIPQKSLMALVDEDIPSEAREWIGPYLEEARLLGLRTGELHAALASDSEDSEFKPEPFTDFYRRGLYQSMLGTVNMNFPLLRTQVKGLQEPVQNLAKQVLEGEGRLRKRLLSIRDRKLTCTRIRCHGDYHLGQVLFTGKDFIIIDFEGEPARPLNVRRLKESPLRDVAGMLRSFHYAAHASSIGLVQGVRPEDFSLLEPWARLWQTWVSVSYLKAYLSIREVRDLLPPSLDDVQILLNGYLLQKAIYELGYELNNRPDWVRIPLDGIHQILEVD